MLGSDEARRDEQRNSGSDPEAFRRRRRVAGGDGIEQKAEHHHQEEWEHERELNQFRAALRTQAHPDRCPEIQDVKRHSDVIAESLRGDIRLVAEGVAGLDEKFTREFRNVREELHEQIGEVKTLLRVSYEDLDRRIRPA